MSGGSNSDYPIGRGRPPKHTRFKPGQSGNPAGRPKGVKNFASILRKALNAKVVVAENGRQRRITKLEAMTTQLVNKATQADLNAMRLLTGLLEFHVEEKRPHDATTISAADQRVMNALVERLKNIDKESGS